MRVVGEDLEDEVRCVEEGEHVVGQGRRACRSRRARTAGGGCESDFSMSRTVTISAISTRGGASRTSIPDGSFHITSATSASRILSVGRFEDRRRGRRHAEQAAQVAELERAVDQADPLVAAQRHGQVVGEGRSTDAALRREEADHHARRRASPGHCAARDLADDGRSGRSRRAACSGPRRCPAPGSSVTGFCGTVSTMIADLRLGLADARRTCCPETRPWSSESTITTSGVKLADRGEGAVAGRRRRRASGSGSGRAAAIARATPPAARPRSPGAGSALLPSLPSTLCERQTASPPVHVTGTADRSGARSAGRAAPGRASRSVNSTSHPRPRPARRARQEMDTRAGDWPEAALSYHRVVLRPRSWRRRRAALRGPRAA